MATIILRLPAVKAATGLSRSAIYSLIKMGDFPKQIHLGPRTVGWDSSAILAWVQAKISAANSKGAV